MTHSPVDYLLGLLSSFYMVQRPLDGGGQVDYEVLRMVEYRNFCAHLKGLLDRSTGM